MALRLAPAGWIAARRLQSRLASLADRRREIGYSMLTIVIFALNGYAVHLGARHGLFTIMPGLPADEVILAVATLVLMIVTHDTYFYWTHRAMHHPRLFRCFHRTHHRSHTPTPWAAYAFDWPEAVVQASFLPLFLLFVPVHGVVLFAFITHMILRNVMGHAGVELFPRGWAVSRWLGWITATVHHDLHHATARWNYGLYFRWWDRMMGTEHSDYIRAFEHATVQAETRDGAAIEKA
ncbi:MAG TPA: sterol desaturase family protein, partial [Vineibacter sp.]|nr:sterol desaturase family protein [Vineibacter sp.]